MSDTEKGWPALIGKAGEALVGAELLRRGVHVAYPAYDGGIDLVAFRENQRNRFIPIQVKAASKTLYHFQKSWFRIEGIVLVQVWHVKISPEFYIFSDISQVEGALGLHSESTAWRCNGVYHVTEPKPDSEDVKRMQPHRDRWDLILKQLELSCSKG